MKLEYLSYTPTKERVYYEKSSDVPYTGKYKSTGINDIVTINFKNGKMHGDLIRINNQGDTTEYIKYKNGLALLQINYSYKDRKLIWRKNIKQVKGSNSDKETINKVIHYIITSDFYRLDEFLNSTGIDSYKTELTSLSNCFGNLKKIELTDINKKINTYKKFEEIRYKLIFDYNDIKLHTSFLVIKKKGGKLIGQGFVWDPVSFEYLPDEKIKDVIDILSKKDVNRFLSIKHLDDKYREKAKERLNDYNKISTSYKFLKTRFLIGNGIVCLKDYLIELDGKRHILTLKYNILSKGVLDLRLFYINHYRTAYKAIHY